MSLWNDEEKEAHERLKRFQKEKEEVEAFLEDDTRAIYPDDKRFQKKELPSLEEYNTRKEKELEELIDQKTRTGIMCPCGADELRKKLPSTDYTCDTSSTFMVAYPVSVETPRIVPRTVTCPTCGGKFKMYKIIEE
jgi:hypothetical protein